LETPQEFVKRLREDSNFGGISVVARDRGGTGARFVHTNGYHFSPAELVCATSRQRRTRPSRVAAIEPAPAGKIASAPVGSSVSQRTPKRAGV